jgi:thiol-disulfide isomerase/thioredoxin
MLALLGEPIALEEIDARGLAALRRNPGGKLRLINVWATWCAPCVVEMPDLVAIDRAFRGPRFETVTVSADDADRRDPALALLRRVKATTTNYRFQGERPALTEALDPAWGGALPFTLLVAPGGQVLFRNEGTLEIDRLRRTIDEWLRRRERRPSSPLR